MNMYVSNLSEEVTAEELKTEFSTFGQVTSAAVIKDKYTGLSRGFGFVEMQAKAEADAAMTALNGRELKGKAISVKEARPRSNDGRGGGFGGSGGYGRGGGGGYGRGGGGGGRNSGWNKRSW